MAFGLPGGQSNTYIPALQDNLRTGWSRNPKDFAVNMLCRYRPVKKPVGLYLYFDPLNYQRFENGSTNPEDPTLWGAGNLRPTQSGPQLAYEARPFVCQRKSYARNVDLLADQVADFDFLKGETEDLAALAMAGRSIEVSNLISVSGSYPTGHFDTATNWGGGFFSAGTEANPIIKRALLKILKVINLDTNATVGEDDLVFVVNPNTAYQMAVAQECHTLFVRSITNKDLLTTQSGLGSNGVKFGLPDRLYGFRVVVMDTSVNYSNRGASGEVRQYIFPDNVAAVVCVKKTGGDQSENGTSNDTAQMFLYEDMTVESQTDQWNRIIKLAVTDHRQAVQVAGVSGALITAVLS